MSLGWGFRYFGRSFFSADGPFCSNDRINRKTEQQQQPRQSTVLCSMSPKDDVFIYILIGIQRNTERTRSREWRVE